MPDPLTGAMLKAAAGRWLKTAPLAYVASLLALLSVGALGTHPQAPTQVASTVAGVVHVDITEQARALHNWLASPAAAPWVTAGLAVFALLVSGMAVHAAAHALSVGYELRCSTPDTQEGIRRSIAHYDFVYGRQQQCASTTILCLAGIVEIHGHSAAVLALLLASVTAVGAFGVLSAKQAPRSDGTLPKGWRAVSSGLGALSSQVEMIVRVAFLLPIRTLSYFTTGTLDRDDKPAPATSS